MVDKFATLNKYYQDRLNFYQNALKIRQNYQNEVKNLTDWISESRTKLDQLLENHNKKAEQSAELYNTATAIQRKCAPYQVKNNSSDEENKISIGHELTQGMMQDTLQKLILTTQDIATQSKKTDQLNIELNMKNIQVNFENLKDETAEIISNYESYLKMQNKLNAELATIKNMIKKINNFYQSFEMEKSSVVELQKVKSDLQAAEVKIQRMVSQNPELVIDNPSGTPSQESEESISEYSNAIKGLTTKTDKELSKMERYESFLQIFEDKFEDIESRTEIIQREVEAAQVLENPDPEYLEELDDTVEEWDLAISNLNQLIDNLDSDVIKLSKTSDSKNKNKETNETIYPKMVLEKFGQRVKVSRTIVSDLQEFISEIKTEQIRNNKWKIYKRKLSDNNKWLVDMLDFLKSEESSENNESFDEKRLIGSEKELKELQQNIQKKIDVTRNLILLTNSDVQIRSSINFENDLNEHKNQLQVLEDQLATRVAEWTKKLSEKNKHQKVIDQLYLDLSKANDFLSNINNTSSWSLETAQDVYDKMVDFRAKKIVENQKILRFLEQSSDNASENSTNNQQITDVIKAWSEYVSDFDKITAEKETEFHNWTMFKDRSEALEDELNEVFETSIKKLERYQNNPNSSEHDLKMEDLKPVLVKFEEINQKANILEKIMNDISPECLDAKFIELKKRVNKANKAVKNLHEKYQRKELSSNLEFEVENIYENLQTEDYTAEQMQILRDNLEGITGKAKQFYGFGGFSVLGYDSGKYF